MTGTPVPRVGQARPLLSVLLRVLALVTALMTGLAFDTIGERFYDGFRIPHAGMFHVTAYELAHLALYFVFGLALVALLTVALRGASVVDSAMKAFLRISDRGVPVAAAVSILVLGATYGIARVWLSHAATSDDEHVYRFIAETLRTGALTAPSPGSDLDLYREQFVVLNEHVRYGKYPIGHPILLALGQAFGLEVLVMPVVTALLVLAAYGLARQVFDRNTATLALLLMATSPQILFTGATLLSQPASALCMVLGTSRLLAAGRGPRAHLWLALAGASFGFGVLVRPLPGLLFALVATGYVVIRHPPHRKTLMSFLPWVSFAAPLAAFAAIFLAVNRAQAGAALLSGYHALHLPGQGPESILGAATASDFSNRLMSLFGSGIRLNFWLLGWPVSLLLCLFARRSPRSRLLWAMAACQAFYSLAIPHTGVNGTGPIYLFEAAPLLCILSASGAIELVTARARFGSLAIPADRMAGVLVACFVASIALFVPDKLADLRSMGDAQLVAPRMIEEQGIHNALVFHNGVVPPSSGLSWAYFPRCNSPRLDDDVLFLRLVRGPGGAEKTIDVWKRRFPGRSAWFFEWKRAPRLLGLESYVRQRAAEIKSPT